MSLRSSFLVPSEAVWTLSSSRPPSMVATFPIFSLKRLHLMLYDTQNGNGHFVYQHRLDEAVLCQLYMGFARAGALSKLHLTSTMLFGFANLIYTRTSLRRTLAPCLHYLG